MGQLTVTQKVTRVSYVYEDGAYLICGQYRMTDNGFQGIDASDVCKDGKSIGTMEVYREGDENRYLINAGIDDMAAIAEVAGACVSAIEAERVM